MSTTEKCDHLWSWHSRIIDGRKAGSVVIVRSCDKCKRREMATVSPKQWHEAVGDYKLDEHYKSDF